MTNRLDEPAATETEKEVVRPILLAWLDFLSGTTRLWSGVGDLEWDSQTWKGIGTLGRVSTVEETLELRAAGMSMQLSGKKALITGASSGIGRALAKAMAGAGVSSPAGAPE